MKETDSKKKFILIYTIAFVLLSLIISIWFWAAQKTFVWMGDGWLQHYRAYLYYGEYLRDILRNIFVEHSLVIPRWDFALGEGADILETLSYYVIGDPFTLFSFLCPSSCMYIYYGLSIFARLYAAGLAFSSFCFYVGRDNRYGILAGTLSYVFCYWCIINLLRHPFFLNPMVYLPLLLLGVERIIREKKGLCMALSVMISAASNVYFFYMLAIMTALYVVVRLLWMKEKGLRERGGYFCRIFLWALLGLAMAALMFVPVAATFLSDARMSVPTSYPLFYPILYYSRLAGTFVSAGGTYAMFMGYSAPVLLAVILAVSKKGYPLLKTFLGMGLIFMLFPVFGQIFNGFSYMTNRWCFAFAMVVCYTLTAVWEPLVHLSGKDAMRLLAGVAIYGMLCFFLEFSRTARVYEAVALALVGILLLLPLQELQQKLTMERKQWCIVVIVGLSIICTVFNKYAYYGSNYLSESAEVREIKEIAKNETTAVKERMTKEQEIAADDEKNDGETHSFSRYAGAGLTLNGNITAGLSSAVYYWTLSNPYVAEFRQALHLPDANSFNYNGYDDRTALNTLSGVKYYVLGGKEDQLPYGYHNATSHKVEDVTYQVAENQNALPLACLMEGAIARKDWERLSFLERQEALLQGVVLEDEAAEGREKANLSLTSEDVDYTISAESSDVVVQDHAIVVMKPESSVTLTFQGRPDCETYLSFHGLKLSATSEYDLYFSKQADPKDRYSLEDWEELSHADRQEYKMEHLFGEAVEESLVEIKAAGNEEASPVQKSLMVFTEDYNHYDGRGDYAVNLKYHANGLTSIELTFTEMGIYSFDDMSVYCQPMAGYESALAQRKATAPKEVLVGTNRVDCKVTASKDALLLCSIPYGKGWTAYVDGKEKELLQADVMYMAVALTKGTHQVQLVYRNPYLKYGAGISLAAWIICLGMCLAGRRRTDGRKRKGREK